MAAAAVKHQSVNGTAVITALVAVLLLLWGTSAKAEPAELWVLTNLEPPFIKKNERGQLEGLIIDIANGILHQAQINQQILAAPWERVFKEASSKANVLVFALARTPGREAQFHWVTPLSSVIVGVFSLHSPLDLPGQLSELDLSQSIGVLDGDYRQHLLQQAGASQIVVLENWTQGTQMLLDGKIQNLFLSSFGMQLTCQRLQRDCGEVKRILNYQQITSYLALSNGTDMTTVALLREAAERYKASQEFVQTSKKWILRYEQYEGLHIHMRDGVINLWPEQASE